MFKTGEIEGFDGAAHRDDLEIISQDDIDRDDLMDQLNQGHEPDKELMAPYRKPIDKVREELVINED